MILSKKSRYGLRALVDLAANSGAEHMALNSIAERNGISAQYLEQVFAALRRAGIVRSIKGPQGGYHLNRPAQDITVAEIVRALDGSYYVEEEVSPAGSSKQQKNLPDTGGRQSSWQLQPLPQLTSRPTTFPWRFSSCRRKTA